jgi:hypothetical protein
MINEQLVISNDIVPQEYQPLKLNRIYLGSDWTDWFVHNVYNRLSTNSLTYLRVELAQCTLVEHVLLGEMNAFQPRHGGIGNRPTRKPGDYWVLLMNETSNCYPRNRKRSSHGMTSHRWLISPLLARTLSVGFSATRVRIALSAYPTTFRLGKCMILRFLYSHSRSGEIGVRVMIECCDHG